MIGRLSRYVFVQALYGVLASATVIVAVIVLIDFVETSRDIATRADISALQALQLTFLKAPLLVQETLPFIVLFGTLMTFFRLNRQSELIVMRASGYSAWRIIAPVAALTALIGLIGAMLLNPLGAASNARFELLRDEILEGRTGAPRGAAGPVWLREATANGFTIVTSAQLDPGATRLERPIFRTYVGVAGAPPALDRQITAQSAELSTGFWTLADAVETTPGRRPVPLGEVSLPTNIGRQALFERARSPGGVSFWRLSSVIESARQAGLSSRPYELRWHSLLALPLLLFAAALVAIAATLRLHRLGGAAGFATTGAAAGFLLYFMQELLLGLGASGAVSAATAAWTTPALFALAGLFFIAATEDG